MFAGWHALHDEIYEIDAERLPLNMNSDLARWCRRLQDEGYEAVRPLLVGSFFGDRMLVAEASREDRIGTAVVDAETIAWYPRQGSRRPLTAEDAYNLVKGRKLLRAFNG